MVVNKVILFGLVAVLASVFFWNTTNRFLYPSKASSGQVGVSLQQKIMNITLTQSNQALIPINILLTTQEQITGATVVVRYDPIQVQYVEQDETYADDECKKISSPFIRRPRVQNDSVQGLLVITRIIDPTTKVGELPTGRSCFGTVMFRSLVAGDSSVSLETTDISAWEFVGPSSSFAPRFDEPFSTRLSVTSQNVQGVFDMRL